MATGFDGYENRKERDARKTANERKTVRDISPIPTDTINWDRRLATRDSLQLYGETYFPNTFNLPLSKDHHVCIGKMESVAEFGGLFGVAMPRGGGKTSWCLADVNWAISHALRVYIMFIGSMDTQATQLLESVKANWYSSPLLQEDFPELAYPIARLENRHHLASGQLHHGRSTSIEWGAKQLRFGSVVLDKDEAKPYLENDPEFLVEIPYWGGWMPRNSGSIISTAGIGGSMRGSVRTHPITLRQVRPDMVILDDVQKDQGAESPTVCAKLERVIDGAIKGMAGPNQKIAAIMPCTVIRPDDVSDTYLSREKKPEWRGERCKMVTSWPEGITDHTIDTTTIAGDLWNQYAEKRKESFRIHEDDRLSREFYIEHREEMDEEFEVSWPERMLVTDISPQQHAMDLRAESPDTFASEFQNNPKTYDTDDTIMPSAADIQNRQSGLDRGMLPGAIDWVVAAIDVQQEILFWSVVAGTNDYNSYVIDYGTWPHVDTRYFRKNQTLGWKLATRAFYKAYEDKKPPGRIDHYAPFEPKIRFMLDSCTDMLLNRVFYDENGNEHTIDCVGYDIGWGSASEACRRFKVARRDKRIRPMIGQFVGPESKQFHEYRPTPGWKFEHQRHSGMKECRWVVRKDETGFWYTATDVNAQKTFLMSRLSSPIGSRGALMLFSSPPEHHEMFADHLVKSEYPEPIVGRGRQKDIWKARAGAAENDWLDTMVMCMTLASYQGANMGEVLEAVPQMAPKLKLSDLQKAKYGNL